LSIKPALWAEIARKTNTPRASGSAGFFHDTLAGIYNAPASSQTKSARTHNLASAPAAVKSQRHDFLPAPSQIEVIADLPLPCLAMKALPSAALRHGLSLPCAQGALL
jgi:hypothetical protein